jgi:hypothetical protein
LRAVSATCSPVRSNTDCVIRVCCPFCRRVRC